MLTKSDLKQIRTVVQEEVHKETDPIKKDTEHLKAGQTRTDKALKSVKKSLDEAIVFLDNERSEVSKRVGRIEDYLHLPTTVV